MKRKKKMKATLSLIIVMAMLLAGCSKSESSSTKDTDNSSTSETSNQEASDAESEDMTTINIRVMNPVTNIDKVLDVYYEKVKDDPVLSKIKVNISYVEGADYADKLTLAVTAQEDYDLMFVGSWQGLSDKINDGVFKDLSSFLTMMLIRV
ncbi:hypothetical protein CG709_17085 [Lachnotalea glycerini]|nr:hypothetical protein CG709_17085 [Lachnotalea glycerini]